MVMQADPETPTTRVHDSVTPRVVDATHPGSDVSPPRGVAISATDVRKSYAVGRETVEILHGVSLSVAFGEMVAVMGPSGSGKSTLLYCLAGLEEPTEGTVALAGRPLSGLSRKDRAVMRRSEIGFVFQQYNLIPTLTAAENISLPYLLGKQKAPGGLIEKTIQTVGLEHRRDARPPSMSGGEQQRVALARVLAQRPRIVFADEPTGALDTRSGVMVLDTLQQLAHQPEQCVLVVTHDPGVAAQCDRALFMRDGVLDTQVRPESTEQVASILASLSAGE